MRGEASEQIQISLNMILMYNESHKSVIVVVSKMELVLAYDRLDEVIQLFKEYTGMIMSQSDSEEHLSYN